ncbi:23S rRNA (adenine(2503)-C(2))-methyltransferase RlmN [Effusibacillus dendaii]|uniref:Probable dual-specificity RNA methyltransferase RlmN n=1 Tax=Effusibacillus dendaii TaxID=2743772 RepID=A0A7I8D8I7_9BACL|nr:23S rRNA (adenine(2503)-C(2))-methyltransferase RlmN [Effusibacillus dendaii]BCJ85126.1 23S rRNA (adenine(2503)-C(2))-methyltransferase RlmN [Effusibacillus dendaii]
MSIIESLITVTETKTELYGMTLDEMEQFVVELSQPKFRAKQIFDWLYKKRVASIDEMSNLPAAFREQLKQRAVLASAHELMRQTSKDGTVKILLELHDGSTVETVLMRHDYGNSVCVSTQVGCRMGCTFCASTLGGLVRNLSAGEIVEQLLFYQRMLDQEGERVSSVVLMGSGEPMENYDAAMKFIDIITSPESVNIGSRHITVSTSGLVPAIRRLADEKRQITLAISLHSPFDELRTSMMPVNRAWNLEKLMEACRYYWQQTGRRLSFEYALIGGVNDDLRHAKALAELLQDLPCHVNLIPVNYVPERNYQRTSKEQIRAFQAELKRLGVNATVRREMGHDISAACGQLRAEQGRT